MTHDTPEKIFRMVGTRKLPSESTGETTHLFPANRGDLRAPALKAI
jgi:hypothetical protein